MKIKYFLIIFSIFLFLVRCTSATCLGGMSGNYTLAEPCLITNCTQLQNMSLNLSGNYALNNNIDCSETLTWNSGAGFAPIGNAGNQFYGTLNGTDYSISNLYINRSSTSNVGLFGYTSGANISQINLLNVNITGADNVGGFIGYATGSTNILNCHISGKVNSSGNTGFAGGFVGRNYGRNIFYSYSEATIYSINGYAGGISGSNEASNGNISFSYSTGNVYDLASSGGRTGGFVGYNDAFIGNSYSTGNVSSPSWVGGFVGNNYDIIINSYSTGNVSGPLSGGFAGYNYNSCSNVYWDNQTSSKSTSYSGCGVGKTTSQMKNVSTYTNVSQTNAWDFVNNPYNDTGNNNYWDINALLNKGYPVILGVGEGSGASIGPSVNITNIINGTSYLDIIELNYTTSDFNGVDSCWWSNLSGVWNSSTQIPGTNWTGLTSNNGWNNWTVYCNDTLGTIDSQTVIFNKDILDPYFTEILNQTSEYGIAFNYQINATDDGEVSCFSVNDTNFEINCSGYLRNTTFLNLGLYWINISVNDSVNHLISSTMWINVSDTTGPTFNNLTNQIIGQYDSLGYQITTTDLSNVSCFNVNNTNFEINCSGYLKNITAFESYYYLINISVNDSHNNLNSQVISITRSSVARIGLNLIYPTGNINATYGNFFNVTVNVSCFDAYCEGINVSLDPTNLLQNGDFETGTLTSWTTGGNANWGINSTGVAEGIYCSKAGAIGHSQITWINRTITLTSNATLSFNWKVSSEGCCDFLIFCNNLSSCSLSSYTNRISGTPNWAVKQYNLTAGTRLLQWAYAKDGSVVSGSDSAWLDNVTILGTSEKSGLISTDSSSTPFYTNISNPYNVTLNHGQSQIITWWVNATGTSITPYNFFVYANLTSNLSIGNITTNWNVTITDITPPVFTNITNKSIEYKSPLSYTISANDAFEISCYSVNDTTNFTMSCSGVLTNKTTLAVGLYNLNITANDTSNNIVSALMWVNVSDTLSPVINITYPVNNTNYITNVSVLNYTIVDNSSLSYCWWSNSSGVWNSSSVSAGTNWTGLTSVEGWNNWTIWCNDTYNNLGNRTNRFFKDTILPVFNNLTNQTTTEVLGLSYQINATDSNNISCFTVNDTTNFRINCTGYLRNNTVLNGGLYNLNITINDTTNNRNFAFIWVNVSDSNSPSFNNVTNQTAIYGNSFGYQLNASDIAGISCFTVNDTTNFNINCSGFLKNNTLLNVGLYNLNITLNDTSNNRNSTNLFVNVTSRPYPQLIFINNTLNNGISTTNTSIEINMSITGIDIRNIIYTWNSTNFTIYNDSLVLMMNFDNLSAIGENSTYAVDVSQYGNNGTLTNGANWNISGKYLKGIQFDGIDDYVSVNNSNSLNPSYITIAGWIKSANTLEEGAPLATKGNGGGGEVWALDFNSQKPRIYFWKGGIAYVCSGNSILSVNQWYYITGTYNGTTLALYLNGVLDVNCSASQGVLSSNTHVVSIGSRQSASSGYDLNFNGSIDEVRIWNRSLSANEVYQQYISNLRKFNSTQWYLYVNQSKNSTDGLDYATYTYQAYASDAIGFSNQSEQRTATITTGVPTINLNYPQNTNYSINISSLNYTVSSNEVLGVCWNSINNGQTNSTTQSPGTNWTGLTSNEGWNNWTVYCNDTLGRIGSGMNTFFKDTILPNATLNSPSENYTTGTLNLINITFNCSAYDNLALKNISLYITNSSNSNFILNRTANITGTTNTTNWTLSLGIGNYTWNCLSYDSLGNSNWSSNRSLTIGFSDTTSPIININYPTNNTSYVNVSVLNYSVSDDSNANSCWWSNSSGVWNSSSVSAGTNWTGLTSVEGINIWTIYCNDTSNNVGSSNIIFYIDNIPPNVTLNSPSENYTGAIVSSVNISFNCSSSDASTLKNISLYITNSSNSNFILNRTANITGTTNTTNWTLSLGIGNYTWNCLSYDSLGNSNWSLNRTINLQLNVAPNITLNLPSNNSLLNKRNSILLNASVSDTNGYLDNFTIWFYGGYANGTFILINTTYNQTNGTSVTFNWTLGSSGRYNWTAIANDGKANSTIYYFYFNLTNFSVSCEAGGPYQQGALVLVQGIILNESTFVSSYPINLSIYDSNNNLDANQNLTTANDGGFETSFANLSAGSYVLNATATYRSYNETCQDTFSVGGSASFILDKTITFHNQTNTTINYNITLRVINNGLSNANSLVLTDSDSNSSPYDIGNISSNSTITVSYIKEYEKNSSAYEINLSVANVNGTDSYSNREISINSSQIIISIPSSEIGQQITLTKNIYYNSENSTSVNYTISINIVNSGGGDLSNITIIDSDLDINTNINLNRTQNYSYLSSVLIDKASSNTNKLFAKTSAVVNSVSYESNQIRVRIPGYGGPADAIVNAPASVSASTSFNAVITVENQNQDIGQDFVIDYWITNENENSNYTSGQQTIYVASSGNSDLTATLTSPSSAGNYKLRALVSWAGGTATAYDSFIVVSSTPQPSSSSSSGGGSVTAKVVDEIICNPPYIRYAKDCCLDINNNSICDTDEAKVVEKEIKGVTEQIKEGEKIKLKITKQNSTQNHSLEVISIKSDRATIVIYSADMSGRFSVTAQANLEDGVAITLEIGEERKIDLNSDGFYDLYIKLERIENEQAVIYLEPVIWNLEIEKQEHLSEKEIEEDFKYSNIIYLFLIIIFVFLIAVLIKRKNILRKNLENKIQEKGFKKNYEIKRRIFSAIQKLRDITKEIFSKIKIPKISSEKKLKFINGKICLSSLIGMEVYSSEGKKVGTLKEIYLEYKNPKIQGWLIKIDKKIKNKIGKRFILLKHNFIVSIKQIIIVDEKILEYIGFETED